MKSIVSRMMGGVMIVVGAGVVYFSAVLHFAHGSAADEVITGLTTEFFYLASQGVVLCIGAIIGLHGFVYLFATPIQEELIALKKDFSILVGSKKTCTFADIAARVHGLRGAARRAYMAELDDCARFICEQVKSKFVRRRVAHALVEVVFRLSNWQNASQAETLRPYYDLQNAVVRRIGLAE